MNPSPRAARLVWTGVLSAALALVAPVVGAAEPQIHAVRFWSLGDVTRIAIETGAQAQYRAELIDTPDRLVVDLIGVRRQAGTRGVQTVPVGDPLVKRLRIAVLEPGVTRMVVDLTAPLEYSVSQLGNPDRIIVELRRPGTNLTQRVQPAPAPPAKLDPAAGSAQSMPIEPAVAEKTDTALPAAPAVAINRNAPPPAARSAAAPGAATPVEAPAPPSRSTLPGRSATPLPARPEIAPATAPPAAGNARPGRSTTARLEPPAPIAPARSTLAAPALAEPKTPPAPFVPPSARSATDPLPEPPRIPPKKERLDTNTPFEKAEAAARDSNGARSLIRTLGLKLDRIVLDPGHGGHDTGTLGPSGTMEKDLVLDVARRLGALIATRIGSEVVYTRSDDTFIPLEERTRMANDQRADLFLSIHANSSRSTRISGSETFYLNFTTSQDALDVAARENATSQTSIHDLQNLVQKIALNEKVQESREFASIMQTSLYAGIPRNRASRNRGVKKAPFVVLIGAQMPSILAEIAFLSNPKDEALLKRPAYRQRVAEALFKGLSQYASALSHFQVAKRELAGSRSQ